MKRFLCVIMGVLCLLVLFGQEDKTIKIPPKKSFVGFTKDAASKYKKQTISSTSESFFVGYDENKWMWGRGYLEFDLSIIPSDAKIISAILRLNTVLDSRDQNKNNKVYIEPNMWTTDFEEDYNWIKWNLIGINPNALFELYGLNIDVRPYYLMGEVQNNIGKKLALYIKNSNENNILRIDGTDDKLYLEIRYFSNKGGTGTPIPFEENYYLIGPETAYAGDVVEFRAANEIPGEVFGGYSYDETYFSLHQFLYYEKDKKYYHKGIQLKIKKNLPDNHVYSQVGTKENGYGKVPVLTEIKLLANPEFTISANTDLSCNNENIVYNIEGFPKETSPATIVWQSISNTTLVSGQNTKSAVFKATGNGYAKVKAIIKYNDRDFIVESSDVWVGPPIPPVEIFGLPLNRELMSNKRYSIAVGHSKPNLVSDFKWSTGSDGYNKLFNARFMTATFETGYKANTTLSALISVRAENRCGVSEPFIWAGSYTCGRIPEHGGYAPTPMSFQIDNSIIENNTVQSYSIRIFDFQSGQMVYEEKAIINFNIENTSLKSGIYILEKTDSQGNLTKTKIRKNK